MDKVAKTVIPVTLFNVYRFVLYLVILYRTLYKNLFKQRQFYFIGSF